MTSPWSAGPGEVQLTPRQVSADELLGRTAKKGCILGAEFLHTFGRNKPFIILLVKPRETVVMKEPSADKSKAFWSEKGGWRAEIFKLGFL